MKLEAIVEGATHSVEIEGLAGELSVVLDGHPVGVDARALEGFFTSILIGGAAYEVTIEPEGPDSWWVQIGIEAHRVRFSDPLGPASGDGHPIPKEKGRTTVTSLMPGKVVRILVGVGEEVTEGQELLVVEAMKMENALSAPAPGRVVEVSVAVGDAVETGAPLVVID